MAVGRSLTVISNLLLVPLFLIRWDRATYGEWLALSSTVAYLSTTDLGMNTAAINELTAAYARRDIAHYRLVQSSASLFYLLFAACLAILCAFACGLLPISRWLALRAIPATTAGLVVWLLAARILLQMLAYQVCGVYRSIGRLSTTEWIWNLQFLLGIAATGWVLNNGGSPLELAAWNIAPLIVVPAIVLGVLWRTNRQLLPRPSDARLATIAKLMKPSLSFGLIMITAALAFNGPIVIASRIVGGAGIALLVSTRTLSNLIRQLIQIATSALWPEITRLYATGAKDEIQAAHRFICSLSSILCSAIAGTLWFEGAEIIQWWTRGRLQADTSLLRLLLVSVVLGAPWLASSLMNMATNRNKRMASFQALSAVITVAASAVLLPYAGSLAIPIGTIVGEATVCYHFIPKEACKVTGADYALFARRVWTMVAVLLLTGYSAGRFAHAIGVGPAPIRWLESAGITLVSCGVIGWRFSAPKAEKRRLYRQIVKTLNLSDTHLQESS